MTDHTASYLQNQETNLSFLLPRPGLGLAPMSMKKVQNTENYEQSHRPHQQPINQVSTSSETQTETSSCRGP